MSEPLDLSVIIPALDEAPNLAILLPEICDVLNELRISYEIFIITRQADSETESVANKFSARVIEERERGYGGALLTGFANAYGSYLLTLDADLSHRPNFIYTIWNHRHMADIIIASRYVIGGRSHMPLIRYFLSRV